MQNVSEYSVYENEVVDLEDARQPFEAAQEMVDDAERILRALTGEAH